MWHTLPSGLHPIALRQTPTAAPSARSQPLLPAPGRPLAASPPQQSASRSQISPVTLQPEAAVQMLVVPSPYGAQRRLQHWLQSPQSRPATPAEQLLAPLGAAPQTPNVAPSATSQTPVQQSAPLLQTSSGWAQ